MLLLSYVSVRECLYGYSYSKSPSCLYRKKYTHHAETLCGIFKVYEALLHPWVLLQPTLNTTTEQSSVTKQNPVILLLYGLFNIRNCANRQWWRELRKISTCRVVSDLWNMGLLIGHGHTEGLSKHCYIVFIYLFIINFSKEGFHKRLVSLY